MEKFSLDLWPVHLDRAETNCGVSSGRKESLMKHFAAKREEREREERRKAQG